MIYIDLDSTLNDLIYTWIEWLNIKEGKDYTIEDITHWDALEELYEDPIAFLREDRYTSVELFPDSRHLIEVLKNIDTVVVLTNNYDFAKKDKLKWWLAQEIKDVQMIYTEGDKTRYLEKDDVFIDDKLETVLEAERVCNNVILYNHNGEYQYNKGDNKVTAKSADEIIVFVEEMKRLETYTEIDEEFIKSLGREK